MAGCSNRRASSCAGGSAHEQLFLSPERLARMMRSPPQIPLIGSCLCKSIIFEARRLCTPIRHCHCATCRKAHASAYTSSAGVLRPDFSILQGESAFGHFESSLGKIRHFCRHCGTHVFAERPKQPHITVRVATLDVDPGERPAHHVWTAHDVNWLTPDCPAYKKALPLKRANNRSG